MVTAWEWFEDLNGNCQIDPGEQTLAGQAAIVFPNDSFTAPVIRFRAPRGNYILRTQYFTVSDLDADSADCFDPVDEDSDVLDVMSLKFSLQ